MAVGSNDGEVVFGVGGGSHLKTMYVALPPQPPLVQVQVEVPIAVAGGFHSGAVSGLREVGGGLCSGVVSPLGDEAVDY